MKSPVRFSSRLAWRIQNLGDAFFSRAADVLPLGGCDFFAVVIIVSKRQVRGDVAVSRF